MMTRRTLLALAASIALASPAGAATLRPFGTLAGATVAVSDLWDDAGAVAAVVLGPSPAPGERIIVEAPQLAAIARQFGVAWTAPSAGARSILERPGLLLAQEKVEAALRSWLADAGAPYGTLQLDGFAAPVVAPDAAAEVSVEQGEWDPASGRFSADLVVAGHAMAALRLRATGRIIATAPALLATRRLASGAILAVGDLTPGTVARERLRGEAAVTRAQAEGLQLRHPLAPGEPVMLANLAPPLLVAKGARVVIAIVAAGVSLTATGEALQAGALGERIAVRNPASRAMLLAEVTGPDAVRVAPGSMPLSGPVSAASATAAGFAP